MSDVFLSYASEDRTRIGALVRALEARGLTVWWDRAIPAGVQYSDYIEGRLTDARCVLVVWSKASIQSEWVKLEAADGKRRGLLVPVRIDAVEQPFEFRRTQTVDLIGWNGNASAASFQKLCADIERLLQGTPDGRAPSPVRPERRVRGWTLVFSGAVLLAAAAAWILPDLGRPVLHLACRVVRCDDRIVVGVMQITPGGDRVETWWCDLTRDMLNATLNKFSSISVVSKQEIEFVREKEGVQEIEAARRLGIERMVSGTLYRRGGSLILQLEVVEPGTGRMRAAKEARGTETELERIQSEGAVAVIKALDVNLPSSQLDDILNLHASARLADYKLMAETMGAFGDEAAPPRPHDGAPHSSLTPLVAVAYAAEPDEAAVTELLERYRKALESEDLEQVAALHVELTDRMRSALTQYFANARDLHVSFEDVTVRLSGDEALASFTRKDEFADRETGRAVRMQLRVSSILERRDGMWRIRGLKRPS